MDFGGPLRPGDKGPWHSTVVGRMAFFALGVVSASCGAEYSVAAIPPPPSPPYFVAPSQTFPPNVGGEEGAPGRGGNCSAAVHPYVTAVETGVQIPLSPDRFIVEVPSSNVTVNPDVNGWSLRAGSPLEVDYDVRDPTTGNVVANGHALLQCEPTYTHVAPPGATYSLAPAPHAPLDNATYVAANIIGGGLVAISVGGLIGGVASIIEASSATPSDSGGETRGIVLVNLAPHVLVAGVMTLVINHSAHARAMAKAGLAAAPFVVPLQAGGALGGVGGTF